MDFENALLSKILLEGCMEEVIDLQVSSDLFVDHLPTWKYLLSTFKKHQPEIVFHLDVEVATQLAIGEVGG